MSNPIPEPYKLPATGMTAGDIKLPFILADWPRIFLNFLALHSNIPLRTREVIATWLLEHNAEMLKYLLENYGIEGAHAAHSLSQVMGEQFLTAIQEDRESHDSDLFAALAEDMNVTDPDADR